MIDLQLTQQSFVVSCQAHGAHPFRDSSIIAALAECAAQGGAAGIRADGPEDIVAIRARVALPIIGIYKVPLTAERFFITPTFDHAKRIVAAGATIVAIEATFDQQPDGAPLSTLIKRIHAELQVPVMADISTREEASRAWKMGVEFVGTTLSGYTSLSPHRETPDVELVSELAQAGMRVIAEGHVHTPEQVQKLFQSGAYAVVVGTAITDPRAITSWYVRAMQGQGEEERQ